MNQQEAGTEEEHAVPDAGEQHQFRCSCGDWISCTVEVRDSSGTGEARVSCSNCGRPYIVVSSA